MLMLSAAFVQTVLSVFLTTASEQTVDADPPLFIRATHQAVAMPSSSINGVVTFTGKVPKKQTIVVSSDAACGREHPLERLLLGQGNRVRYSLVFLKNPPAGSTTGMKPATMTQTSCRFSPHMVIAARGSSIEFQNEDPVLHNCHGYFYTYTGNTVERSTAFNLAQPNQGQVSKQELRKQGMINVECDAGHTWMSSWIWVTSNPYATVTNEKGEFSFEGIPPGTYTVVMWHEGWEITETGVDGRPVFSDPIVQEREIVVGDGAIARCDFDLH
jgi:plastocyanin